MNTPKLDLIALAAMARAHPSKLRRLAELQPEVQAAIAAGATRAQVLDVLRRHELNLTERTFSTYMSRLRQPHRARGSLAIVPCAKGQSK